jgi:hypothetical protein
MRLMRSLFNLRRALVGLPRRIRGARLADRWTRAELDGSSRAQIEDKTADGNPIQDYYVQCGDGPRMQKWLHYPEIYDRHLSKFIGRESVVVEIGVDGGGSLQMWRQCFGPACTVHGIDIDPECLAFSGEGIIVHTGDQADRAMWNRFRANVPQIDILIDDGGHNPEQQILTLEEMLPHLRPGGVYICEDVHGCGNGFAEFAYALCDRLNAGSIESDTGVDTIAMTPFQASIHSVHLYPLLVLIEKHAKPALRFSAPLRGAQ